MVTDPTTPRPTASGDDSGAAPGAIPGAGEPALVALEAWDGLVFSTKGAYWKLSGAFGRLHAWMDAHAVNPAGPALGLFYDDPAVTAPEECRYSLCYPLSGDDVPRLLSLVAERAATDPADTLEVRRFAAESAVVVEYQGPAADSPAVYALLASWITTHGLTPQGAPRERYIAEPGTLGGGRMHAWVEQAVAGNASIRT